MLVIKIYAGEKTTILDGNKYIVIFDDEDTDTAYQGLCENLKLTNPTDEDVVNFQNLKDTNVRTLLKDARKQGFISDYEIEYKKN